MSSVLFQPSAIDPKLVVPFVLAVRELFKKMVKVDVTIGKSFTKTASGMTYEVSGIIGFTGEVVGSVAATFSKEAAVKLVESFCGMRLEPDSPDFPDAIGELANMIAGAAKANLATQTSITTPTVVMGQGVSMTPVGAGPCLVIPCQTPCGDFAVEVAVVRKAA